jgi:hypothetical protein
LIELDLVPLPVAKMADTSIFRVVTLMELAMDDETDEAVVQFLSKSNAVIGLQAMERRDWVPKIRDYMTNVIGAMSIPENVDDFEAVRSSTIVTIV